jgi:hypothetical protein
VDLILKLLEKLFHEEIFLLPKYTLKNLKLIVWDVDDSINKLNTPSLVELFFEEAENYSSKLKGLIEIEKEISRTGNFNLLKKIEEKFMNAKITKGEMRDIGKRASSRFSFINNFFEVVKILNGMNYTQILCTGSLDVAVDPLSELIGIEAVSSKTFYENDFLKRIDFNLGIKKLENLKNIIQTYEEVVFVSDSDEEVFEEIYKNKKFGLYLSSKVNERILSFQPFVIELFNAREDAFEIYKKIIAYEIFNLILNEGEEFLKEGFEMAEQLKRKFDIQTFQKYVNSRSKLFLFDFPKNLKENVRKVVLEYI